LTLKSATSLSLLLIAVLASLSHAQTFPSEIRGYKVHRLNVYLRTGDPEKDQSGPALTIGSPDVVSFALTGITIEAAAEIAGLDQEGEVDFLTFKDIVANGIPLDVEEYQHPFKLKKHGKVVLPVPVRGTVSAANMAKAAYQESTAPKDDWQVTGTVFVFGHFKTMGITFKRVIPVPVTLTVPNPIKAITAAAKTH